MSLYRYVTPVRWLHHFVLTGLLLLILTGSVRAAGGTIQSLTASSSGNVVTVNVTIHADIALALGNLLIDVRTPSGVVIGSTTVSVPVLVLGQNFSTSANINVSGWNETGNYSVRACWSLGLLGIDCAITVQTTTFFHVPTLGDAMMMVALFSLGGWLWYMRKKLMIVREFAS